MRTRLLLRQAASSIGASIAIALIVAVAAGLFTAWPRLERATFVDELNYRIAQTSETARALVGSQANAAPVGPDGMFAAGHAALDGVVADAGPTLRDLLGTPEMLVAIDRAGVGIPYATGAPNPPGLTYVQLRFRAIATLAEHTEIVDGEAPAAWSPAGASADEELAPIPVAMSTATAERLDLQVGSTLDLEANIAFYGATGEPLPPPPVVVAGIFDATDPDEAYWDHQTSGLEILLLADPNVGDTGVGAAYVHPDTADSLAWAGQLVPRTEVWIPITAGTDDAPGLLDDLREITARQFPLDDEAFSSAQVELETALTEVIGSAIIAQRGTSTVLALVAAGPVGVMFAVVALATRLSVTRRRDTLSLASARGGSPGQIRGALALEGLALGLPAASVGAAIATIAVPGAVQIGDYALAVLAGLAPAAFLAGASLPHLRTERHDLAGRSSSRWRWVAETLVIAAAAASVYLLLSRGLLATTTTTVDPLAAGTPLLISLATAVVATRLFPYPMRVAHAVSRRRRDLAPFLGSARAIREGGAGLVPMLALLVATSIAVFSTTMLATLAGGLSESTRTDTGADVRVSGAPYTDDLVEQIHGVPVVAETARVFTQSQTWLSEDDESRRVTLYAVDTATLSDVQVGVTGAVTLPAGMGALIDGKVPIVLSEAMAPAPDSELAVAMNDVVPVALVGTAPNAGGIATNDRWAVVDLDLMREVSGQNLVPRLVLVDLVDGADPAAAATTIGAAIGGIGAIETAEGEQAGLLESPSAASMQRGFVVTLVISVLQSVLALVITLVLAAPARGRLVAVLRTLGVGPRDGRRLVSWEVVPLAAVALVAGTALGLLLPYLVVETVDLSVFTGTASPTVIHDWPRLAAVLAGVVVIVGITLLVASALARRLSLSVLRIGDPT